jgi:hypothetical protein
MTADLDAIAEDIAMAKRSAEIARHVALDHGPELISEIKGLRAEVGLLRGGCNVRPMTEVESNLMTQVLALRRENARLRAQEQRVRDICTEPDHKKWMRELSRGFDGKPICAHTVPVDAVLAVLNAEES